MRLYQDVLGGVVDTPGLVHFLAASLKAFALSLVGALPSEDATTLQVSRTFT